MESFFEANKEIPIGSNYTLFLNKKLGSGAFGEVYKGKNRKTQELVAIKMEPTSAKHHFLEYETNVLRYLRGSIGIPNVYDYFSANNKNFMIFELLGPSLASLFEQFNYKFSLKTILILGDQMLSRVELLHKRHIIHRDIKPDNFLIGTEKKKNQVYLIDFGLAKRFRDPRTGLHNPYKDGKSLTGTARYASIYTHLGIDQSRRDDLESLAYTLIYLGVGSLPWQKIRAKKKEEKYQLILEKKINCKLEDICKDLPEEFITFLQYTRNLLFEEKPDYNHLRNLLSRMYEKNDFEMDMICDWNSFIEKKERYKLKQAEVKEKKANGKDAEDKDKGKDKENESEIKIKTKENSK